MKKTLLFAMMAAVLGFTDCSKEEPIQYDINQTEAPRKGMVLRATVEQPTDTKATFADNEGVWHFDFEEGDIIKVTNSEIGADRFYTFTYDGEKFVSEDAEPTTGATTWYANFPSNKVSLVEQSGAWEDIADKYVMTGSTTYDVTGKEGLSITMSPKVSILKIIDLKGDVSINVKNSSTTWVSGYKAEKGLIKDFYMLDPVYRDTKQTLLSATKPGTYYIAVPAGVQISIKDGEKSLKSTGENGLTAGKYYDLTIFPSGQGVAEATINGSKVNVKWIQLWEDGPKWAEYNIGAKSATEYGSLYAWGGSKDEIDDHNTGSSNLSGDTDTATTLWGNNWRMPTLDELAALINFNSTYCTIKWIDGYKEIYNGAKTTGILCSGKGDYESNSVFIPFGGTYLSGEVNGQGGLGHYWSSTHGDGNYAYYLDINPSEYKVDRIIRSQGISVRAVLNE